MTAKLANLRSNLTMMKKKADKLSLCVESQRPRLDLVEDAMGHPRITTRVEKGSDQRVLGRMYFFES